MKNSKTNTSTKSTTKPTQRKPPKGNLFRLAFESGSGVSSKRLALLLLLLMMFAVDIISIFTPDWKFFTDILEWQSIIIISLTAGTSLDKIIPSLRSNKNKK